MRKRGMTLIEATLTMALSAMVIGVMATLYAFASARSAHAVANQAGTYQASKLLDEIQKIVHASTVCSAATIGSANAIKCTLPTQGIDRRGKDCTDKFNSNGSAPCESDPPSRFRPQHASRRGAEEWGANQRVWFYLSNASGTPGTAGTYVWRARRNDDLTPTSSNIDSSWAAYYATGPVAFNLISLFTLSVNAANQSVTVSVRAGSVIGAKRIATTQESAISDSITASRTIYWRNWRQ